MFSQKGPNRIGWFLVYLLLLMSSTTVPNPANGSFPSRSCRLNAGWTVVVQLLSTEFRSGIRQQLSWEVFFTLNCSWLLMAWEFAIYKSKFQLFIIKSSCSVLCTLFILNLSIKPNSTFTWNVTQSWFLITQNVNHAKVMLMMLLEENLRDVDDVVWRKVAWL